MHAHSHSHGPHAGHDHGHGRPAKTILTLGAAATLAYVVVAFVVGLQAHSLALVSEAGHNLTDFLALALTWLGVYFQTKPPTARKTFGFHRAGVLTALANVLTLFVITVLIVVEAIERLRTPQTVATGPMLWVAAIGLVMNAAIALALESGSEDVNLRAAFLHMVGDAFATALVILGAIVIRRTGWLLVDPILSLVIGGLIVASGWGVLHETLNILLEGAPRGLRSDSVAADLAAVEGVEAVHDLHIWSLGSQSHALSAHLQIADIPPSASDQIRQRVCALLAERYAIRHTTLQFEHGPCGGGCLAAEDIHR
ncbi:MAG TPA: cation diffusion facilitator family transporter [Terriglobales bacterium]|nr:cation diffusion facilitator family transporter [Terriglobales bacterium]